LKEFNLIDFGDRNHKGKPLLFTDLGRIFLEVLGSEKGGRHA